MPNKNRVIKFRCCECFKEFDGIDREIALSHVNFAHTHIASLQQINDES